MNETPGGKSMDDVLASIRQIVNGDKGGAQPAPPADPEPQTPPEPQAGPASEYQPDSMAMPTADESDAPLELTPDMLKASETAAPVEVDSVLSAAAPVEMAQAAVPDDLRGMVREAVLEALSGDQGSELVRDIIRDELVNGEIGGNISENVLRLIQAEVADALNR